MAGNLADLAPEVWYVLRTKSRHERIVARQAAGRGLIALVPFNRRPRRYGAYEVVVDEPVLPGFLFLRGTARDASAAAGFPHVVSVTPIANQLEFGSCAADLGAPSPAPARGAAGTPADGLHPPPTAPPFQPLP